MKIKQIEYYNKITGWKLEPIKFSDLTLLIGISGVGKTQILKTILDLKKIAAGTSLSGLKWDIIFSPDDDSEYQWQGEFENKGSDDFNELLEETYRSQPENQANVVYEKLYLNQKLIIDRNQETILFNTQRTPKLSPHKSILHLLGQEDEIAPAYQGFNKIIQSNDEIARLSSLFSTQFKDLSKKYQSLTAIQESGLTIHFKLALAYRNLPDTFNQIKNHFSDVFPQVTDIKLEAVQQEGLHLIWADYPLLQIQEKDVNTWIYEQRISAGMRKVLMQISDMYLSPSGTIILIDEFENSLGVNCIDVLTDLLTEDRNIQFIVTSHHPYIINNIGMQHWKIVNRHGGTVTATAASAFNLGKSRHDAFIQLINLKAYQEGITA